METVFSHGTIVINIWSYASYRSNIPSYNSAKATMYERTLDVFAIMHISCSTSQGCGTQ